MRPSIEQASRMRAMLEEVKLLRDVVDSDGENDLGAALEDAAHGLDNALAMIDGRGPGQMIVAADRRQT